MNNKYINKITNDKHQFAYTRIDGSVVVPFGIYDWGDEQFVFGFARVSKNNKWGIINTLGQIVVPLVYDKIWVISENYISATKCVLGETEKLIDLKKASKLCILDGLEYIKTYSISEFKELMGISKVDVKKSPVKGENYFQAGYVYGKVSFADLPKSPKISLVKNSNNVVLWLLHEEEDTGKMYFLKSSNAQKSIPSNKEVTSKKSYYCDEDIDYEEQTLDAFEGDESNYWNID